MSVVITDPALQSEAVPFSYLPPTGYSLINVKLPQPPSRVAFRWSLPSISPPFGSSGAVRPHFSPSASISVRRPVCLVPHLSACGKPCWLRSMSHACFVITSVTCHFPTRHVCCLYGTSFTYTQQELSPSCHLAEISKHCTVSITWGKLPYRYQPSVCTYMCICTCMCNAASALCAKEARLSLCWACLHRWSVRKDLHAWLILTSCIACDFSLSFAHLSRLGSGFICSSATPAFLSARSALFGEVWLPKFVRFLIPPCFCICRIWPVEKFTHLQISARK